jgi:hypothetical protein
LLQPENTNVKNLFLREIYQDYYAYLNWSLNKNYLSRKGFEYKLSSFKNKFENEIIPSYNSLIESLKVAEWNSDLNEDVNSLNNKIFNILFNSNEKNLLHSYDKQVLISKFLEENKSLNETNIFFRFKKRKLLDTFADSLLYVNKLFNNIYGLAARKVPSHMPHMIGRYCYNC